MPRAGLLVAVAAIDVVLAGSIVHAQETTLPGRDEPPVPSEQPAPASSPAPITASADEADVGSPGSGEAAPTATNGSTALQIRRIDPRPVNHLLRLTAGRPLNLVLDVVGVGGQPIEVEVIGLPGGDLPRGATFDRATLTLRWRPEPSQVGTYPIRIVARSAGHQSTEAISLVVTENHAPYINPAEFVLFDGTPLPGFGVDLGVYDRDHDAVSVEVTNVPPGVRYDPGTSRFYLSARDARLGTYRVRVRASDGLATSEQWVVLSIRDVHRRFESRYKWKSQDDWVGRLLPGGGWVVQATGSDALGTLTGPTLELHVISWVKSNPEPGSSHGRFYVKAELLKPSGTFEDWLVFYAFGADLSFESNPHRTWLVPHAGAEFGGLTHERVGHLFQTTPYVGLHLWSTRHVLMHARTGYRLVPTEFEPYSGWHTTAAIDFMLW